MLWVGMEGQWVWNWDWNWDWDWDWDWEPAWEKGMWEGVQTVSNTGKLFQEVERRKKKQ